MNISELLRKLADVIASAEGADPEPQFADLSPVKVDHQDNTITVSAGRTAFLRFWSTGTTANDLFCQATYG